MRRVKKPMGFTEEQLLLWATSAQTQHLPKITPKKLATQPKSVHQFGDGSKAEYPSDTDCEEVDLHVFDSVRNFKIIDGLLSPGSRQAKNKDTSWMYTVRERT